MDYRFWNASVSQNTNFHMPRNSKATPYFLNSNKFRAKYSRFSSVMWSKLKIVTVQEINSRIWDMIDDCNINNLAKNLVSVVFHSRAIRRSVSSKFIEICIETPCWCPSGWAPTWRPETNRNICLWVLLQKRKFISRGTQNIKILFFLIQEPVQIAKFPEIVTF